MESNFINQLVLTGSAPFSCGSPDVIERIIDGATPQHTLSSDFEFKCHTKRSSTSSTNDGYGSFGRLLNSDGSPKTMGEMILNYASFKNRSVTMLLQSALGFTSESFRTSLHTCKRMYKERFIREINQRDKHQYTLGWYLAIAGLYNCIDEMCRVLLDDFNIDTKCGPHGQTMLHYTVVRGHPEEVRLILRLRANVHQTDRFGRTALHYLALFGNGTDENVAIAGLLIAASISLNLQDYRNRTGLHYAVINEDNRLVEYLLQQPTLNISLRDNDGYTAVGYLCERILCRLDGLTDEQSVQDDRLETIFQLLERIPKDQLITGSRIIVAEQTTENLFFTVSQQLIELGHPAYGGSIFDRHASMILRTANDNRCYAQRLLRHQRWRAAIDVLRDTHDVDISQIVLGFLAKDPNSPLTQILCTLSDLSMFCVLIFYGLASHRHSFHTMTPMCSTISKDSDANLPSQRQDRFPCGLSFENVNLHASYVTLLHTCVHDATLHVYKLKHWSRLHLRRNLNANIRQKLNQCSALNEEQRDYISFQEMSLIYSEMTALSSIVQLIQRLFNIESIDQEYPAERVSIESPSVKIEDIPKSISDTESSSTSDDEIDLETEQKSSQTIVMDHPDQRVESEENADESTPSKSIDEVFTGSFAHELADIQAKTHDIEAMIDKYLSQK